jgi:hypothetical protein
MQTITYDESFLSYARDLLKWFPFSMLGPCLVLSRPSPDSVSRGSSRGRFLQGRRYISLPIDRRDPDARGLSPMHSLVDGP